MAVNGKLPTPGFYLSLILLLLSACNTNMVNTGAEEQKLMKMTKDWSDSVKINSVDKNLSYYTEDAMIMVSGEPSIKGKAAIRPGFEETAKRSDMTLSWTPLSAHVSASNDLAYMTEENKVLLKDSSGKTKSIHGKGVVIWKKQADGNWKVALEIWNDTYQETK